jgi:NDP-sugar pyrophosphorylase family protein
MILAAGLGTRMRPLSELRAKPALPVRGRPVIGLLLDLLARHGIRDVMINLHHRPTSIRDAVERERPMGLAIHWSEEPVPLGTGGGIRRAAEFLRESNECLVIAGDMLLDLDLGMLFAHHRASRNAATLVLREDHRAPVFGTIGFDADAQVTRIGTREIRAGEVASGLFTGVRVFSRSLLDDWPGPEDFEDLRDWLVPAMLERDARVGAWRVGPDDSVWEPVGTPSEYLRVNLDPPALPSLGGPVEKWTGEVELVGAAGDVILGSHAQLGEGAHLEQSVVWEDERVPAGFRGALGVFAGGQFHACTESRAASRADAVETESGGPS